MTRANKKIRPVPAPTPKMVRGLLNSLEDTAEAMAVIRTIVILSKQERRTQDRLRMIQVHLRRLVPFDRFALLRLRAGGVCDVLWSFDGRAWSRGGTSAWPGTHAADLKAGKVRIRKRIAVRSLPIRPSKQEGMSHVGDATIPLGAGPGGLLVLHLACYEPDRILPEHRDILDLVQPALSVALPPLAEE